MQEKNWAFTREGESEYLVNGRNAGWVQTFRHPRSQKTLRTLTPHPWEELCTARQYTYMQQADCWFRVKLHSDTVPYEGECDE